jgi:hypothetical protein
VSRWQIPPRDPVEVSVVRLRELESVTEKRIRNQHVVSKVILRGFAAPGHGGKGWMLTPFDVRAGREGKPRGLTGCGRVPDFLMCAADVTIGGSWRNWNASWRIGFRRPCRCGVP